MFSFYLIYYILRIKINYAKDFMKTVFTKYFI